MDSLKVVLRLFGHHLGLAALLALGVIAIYWAAYGFLSISSKIFVGYPVEAIVAITRRCLGIPTVRRRLETGHIDNARRTDKLANRLDSASGLIQRKLEWLRSRRHLFALLLFRQEALIAELRALEKGSVRILETDRSVLESLSADESLSERGALRVFVDPQLKELISPAEELAVLLAAWKRGGGVADIARYHLVHSLTRFMDLRATEQIVKDWPTARKAELEEFLSSVGR